MMGALIEARALRKRYGDTEVVRGIDFTVGVRECVGFLGPNGAGKTTTIRMITCASPVSGGELKVFGLPVEPRHHRTIKARLGVVPQEDNLDPDLRVETNLVVYASYYGIPRATARARARELLAFMQLEEKREARIETLSGGMKRRLAVARALIAEPALLVLDEPTTGLDPQARHLVWDKLRQLKRAGTTMLLTTHYMEEASQLCDRVLILDRGTVIAAGSPRELVAEHVGSEVIELFVGGDRERAQVLLRKLSALVPHVEQAGDVLLVTLDGGIELARLLPVIEGEEFVHRPANLEDVFLRLTGRELRE